MPNRSQPGGGGPPSAGEPRDGYRWVARAYDPGLRSGEPRPHLNHHRSLPGLRASPGSRRRVWDRAPRRRVRIGGFLGRRSRRVTVDAGEVPGPARGPCTVRSRGCSRYALLRRSFDPAVAMMLFHGLPREHRDRTLAEILRVLVPMGHLLIVDHTPASRRSRRDGCGDRSSQPSKQRPGTPMEVRRIPLRGRSSDPGGTARTAARSGQAGGR